MANSPLPDSPTVKGAFITCPGEKFELDASGRATPAGYKVRYPPFELTTVALPTIAVADDGMLRPPHRTRACCVRSCPPINGEAGAKQACPPTRVSNNRTGLGSGWKYNPPVPGGA